MKKILLALAVAATSAVASAQYTLPGNPAGATYLIAGFDFSQLSNDGNMFDSTFENTFKSLDALYTDTTVQGDRSNNPVAFQTRGTVYFDGQFGSDVFDGESGLGNASTIGGGGTLGNSVNASILTSRRVAGAPANLVQFKNLNTEGGTENSLGFQGPGASGASDLAFVFNTTGYGLDFDLSLSAWTNGGTGSIQWFVGGNLAGTTSIDSTVPSTKTVDFSSFTSALGNTTNATIIARVVAADNIGLNIDNIQFTGQALIPEPSTYAAMLAAATFGVAALRRRKSAV